MIKINQSQIHKFPVIYFFSGNKRSVSPSEFLFEESIWLFGNQNLASNLIEYDLGDAELKNLFISQEFESLVKSIESRTTKKITLIKVYLSTTLKSDIEIMYYGSSLSAAGVNSCDYTLNRHLGLNADLINKTESSVTFGKELLDKFHFCEIGLNELSVQKNHNKLSERFKKSFSSNLYVDTQVPFIMLTPCFGGSSLDREVN